MCRKDATESQFFCLRLFFCESDLAHFIFKKHVESTNDMWKTLHHLLSLIDIAFTCTLFSNVHANAHCEDMSMSLCNRKCHCIT